jgi:hypothetical protein
MPPCKSRGTGFGPAVTNYGNSRPVARLTPTLSPATPPKVGSLYDMSKTQTTLF